MKKQLKPKQLKPLARRLKELPVEKIPDRRSTRGWHRHLFLSLVNALILGMATARRSLRQVETLTEHLHPKVRKITQIWGRISDSKLRDAQNAISAEDVRPLLHSQIKIEHRRGTLKPVKGLPFGIVALDGKGLGILDNWEHPNIQKVQPEGRAPYGKALVHRTTLVSSVAPVCIDQRPVPGDTNEIGACKATLEQRFETYGKTSLFEMVAADAGNASAAVATQIDTANYAYLLRMKENHGGIYCDALAAVHKTTPVSRSERYSGPKDARRKHVYHFYQMRPEEGRDYHWAHLRQWLCLVHEVFDEAGALLKQTQRLWASNLPWKRLKVPQWLLVLRRYWRCENNNHWTADVFFKEDARRQPWTKAPETLFMLANLRMLALNITAIRRAMSRASGTHAHPQPLGWRETLDLILTWAYSGRCYQNPQPLLL